MNNYEITKKRMQKEFLTYDQKRIIQKFYLHSDGNYIYLKFVNAPYRINRSNGCVEKAGNVSPAWQEAGHNEAMTIYDILCCAKENCRTSGEFVPIQNLSAVQTGAAYAGKGLLDHYVDLFDHREKTLVKALEQLDGIKEKSGDVCYKIPVFGELALLFRFWNSDEEFPASLQILCDKNMLDFMHYETIWFLASYIVERLTAHMAASASHEPMP